MSRGRESKQAAAIAAAIAVMKAAGKDIPEPPVVGGHNYRSNDAVVVFANMPAHFRPGVCKNCKKPFAANKKSVGFCSDPCRHEDWRKTTGIPWSAVSTNDVWNGDPPMIITPDQYRALKNISEWFSRNQTVLENAAATQSKSEQEGPEPELEESKVLPDFPVLPTLNLEELKKKKPVVSEVIQNGLPSSLRPQPSFSVHVDKDGVVDPFGF